MTLVDSFELQKDNEYTKVAIYLSNILYVRIFLTCSNLDEIR